MTGDNTGRIAPPSRALTAAKLGIPGLDEAALDVLRAQSQPVHVPRGATVFAPGDACEALVLLTKGAIQVRVTSEQGRELTLYRVRPGETCVMSVACLMGRNQYQAEAISEADVEGVAIGRATFENLLASSAAFRTHILTVQTHRIFDLVSLVDEVAFHRTEARLAARLLALSAGGAVVTETHQQLADDIGTAREVVSRRLKRFETRGLVTLDRRQIVVRDARALARLAE